MINGRYLPGCTNTKETTMALIKKGSPSQILKVAELEKKDEELKLKVLADKESKKDEDKNGG